MKNSEESTRLLFRPRPTELIAFKVPSDTLKSLQRVAVERDMSLDTLIRFYVGQGLRQDLARLFSDRVLETAAEVLARHIASEEERTEIMREIRLESV
jgi:hypothetical protein